MKSINENDYVAGYLALHAKWLEIINDNKAFDDFGEGVEIQDKDSIVLSEKSVSENQVIKNDAYQKLSSEAKVVIDIVLNTPSEILELIATPKLKKIKPAALRSFLNTMYSKKAVRKVYREMKKFTSNF